MRRGVLAGIRDRLRRSSSYSSGFTLIELLTVISIIGVITTVVTVNLSSARKQARDVRRKTDVTTLQSAVELYASANGGKVPAAIAPGKKSTDAKPWINDAKLLAYLTLPTDPQNDATFFYLYHTGPAGTKFQNSYIIDTVLEAEDEANANIPAPSLDPNNPGFYVQGTYKAADNTVHYRVTSGQ